MWLACEEPPKSCLTCVVSPAVWLLLVLWLTWATLSYLHLFVLSAEIGAKQNSNRRLQIKATGVRCIFSFLPLLTLEKLPSSVGYKTPPPHKLTVNFGAVFFFFFYMWNTQRESAKKEKECEWVWPLSQAQGSQWGVFNQTLPTRRPLFVWTMTQAERDTLGCHFITSQSRNKVPVSSWHNHNQEL